MNDPNQIDSQTYIDGNLISDKQKPEGDDFIYQDPYKQVSTNSINQMVKMHN